MPVKNMKMDKLQEVLDEYLTELDKPNVTVTSGTTNTAVQPADVGDIIAAMKALKLKAGRICQQGLLAFRVSRP